jgi:hypothetical protein
MTRAEERQARAQAKTEEDERATRPLRSRHAWMTVRALRLLEARGVNLRPEDAREVVNYVYEQDVAHAIDTIRHCCKRCNLAQDVLCLQAIILLGHAPERDPTPMPELPE